MTSILNQIAETKQQKVKASLAKRKSKERRFRLYGVVSISAAILFLVVLIASITSQGYTAFFTTEIRLKVNLDAETLGLISEQPTKEELFSANYMKALRNAIRNEIPVTGRKDRKALYSFISRGAEYKLRDQIVANPSLVGGTITYWALAGDLFNQYNKAILTLQSQKGCVNLKTNRLAGINSSIVKARFVRYLTKTSSPMVIVVMPNLRVFGAQWSAHFILC